MMASLGEVNADKMIEEQKQVVVKAQIEIKKDLVQQSESLQKRLADRKKRLVLKQSMNSSVNLGLGGEFDSQYA